MSEPHFDVFLSYSSEDVLAVERLAIALADTAGLRPWLDKWQLIPGEPWLRELERGLLSSRTCAACVGSSGRGPWQTQEVDAALRAQVKGDRDFRVIPVLLPEAPATAPDLPIFLQGNTWVRFKSLDDAAAMWRLECGIKGERPGRGRPVPAPQTPMGTPTFGSDSVGEVGEVVIAPTPRHVFISYHDQEPDKGLAYALDDALRRAGHEVFVDIEILKGTQWAKRIREALGEVDYLLLLISKEAAASEVVAEKVEIARELAQERGSPVILPVRVRYPVSEPLSYVLAAYLRKIHQESWAGPDDTARLVELLLRQISAGGVRSADSEMRAPTRPFKTPAPAPYLDPRPHPGGAIDIEARYYVLRKADEDVIGTVRRPRGLATVRGSRQSGKTSLILRTQAAVEQAEDDLRAVYVDFQALSRDDHDSLDGLWHAIADHVARRLEHDDSKELYWKEGWRYDRNFERLLDSIVFRGSDNRLLLCLDEIDRVFRFEVSSEFFASVRSFYNRGAHDPTWKRVSWLLGTSSEPAFFIEDLTQSPFNIGFRAELPPFTEAQISEFAGRFGMPREIADPGRILAYVGGQPYLVHLVLHHLERGDVPPEQLFDTATAARTVFREHLLRFLLHFQQDEPLARAMKRVVAGKGCDNARLADRLEGAGLVQRDADEKLVPLCELYAEFFREEL